MTTTVESVEIGMPPQKERLHAQSVTMKAGGCSAQVVLVVASLLCLSLGIAVIVVPSTWTDFSILTSDNAANHTCPAITPESAPQSSQPVGSRSAYIAAWDAYANATLNRPEGVRANCEPLRFPAVGPYRGVALIWHGFSSCPQEMATMAPPLAAHGFDVLIPLMEGHGNAIVYEPDAGNWIWGFVVLGVALAILSCFACCRCLPCAGLCCGADRLPKPYQDAPWCSEHGSCNHHKRTQCLAVWSAAFGALAITGLIACIFVWSREDRLCFSLSFVDGVGPGCGGMAEYNRNLPHGGDPYKANVDAMNDIVRLAPGIKVLAGLSGGGAAAAYGGQAIDATTGEALFARQLLLAPYVDVATIGPALGPAVALGLGDIKVDFGRDCRISRRDAGKAGYCNYALASIVGMRDVGQSLLDGLSTPPGTVVQIVKVANDPTVTNRDITRLAESYARTTASTTSSTSLCVLNHVDDKHSPLSVWNYIHTDYQMDWIPELICQITRYLADGVPMPTNGLTSGTRDSDGEPSCANACTNTSLNCDYDCVADAFLTCP